ncbi:MAG: hypothetical protein R2827_16685 [Bdellovibrionales bacterium]
MTPLLLSTNYNTDRKICKPLRKQRPKNSIGNSGQSVIEFLLLLVVVIGIFMTAIYQFTTAFSNYSFNYFGSEESYIGCLLKTGQLPQQGAAQGPQGCSFQNFDYGDGSYASNYNPGPGNPYDGTGGYGPGGDGTGGYGPGGDGTGGYGPGGDGTGGYGPGGDGTGGYGPGGDGTGGGSSSVGNNGGPNSQPNQSPPVVAGTRDGGGYGRIAAGVGASRGGSSQNSSQLFEAGFSRGRPGRIDRARVGTAVKDDGFGTTDFGDTASNRSRQIPVSRTGVRGSGNFDNYNGVEQETRFPASTSKSTIPGRERKKANARIQVTKKYKSVEVEDDSLDLGIGDYFRYLIIIVILIAIVVFFGIQMNSIMKSLDV